MRMIRVLVVMLALVLTSTQGTYSDTEYPSFNVVKLVVTGPYPGDRYQIEAEYVLDSNPEYFTLLEGDPKNKAEITVDFLRPGTKDDKTTDGTIPTWVSTGPGETVWKESPPLPGNMGRTRTLKEFVTAPAGTTQFFVRGLFVLGSLPSSHEQWFDLANVPTGANQNPTVEQFAITPTEVTSATKTVTASATASDPDNDVLTFTWYLDGAVVAGPTLNLNGIEISKPELDRLDDREYTVTVKVDDGRGGVVPAESRFTVQKEKNEPPEVDLQRPSKVNVHRIRTDPKSPLVGTGKKWVADADDPDGERKELKYEWWTGVLGGPLTQQMTGQGEAGRRFTWAPIPPGRRYVVEVRITDSDGASVVRREVFDQRVGD